MSRSALQIVNASLGLVTIALALMAIAFGVESPVYGSAGFQSYRP